MIPLLNIFPDKMMEATKIIEVGVIEKVSGKNKYWVKIEKSAACGSCKACNFGKNNFIVLPAIGEEQYNQGDRVRVETVVRKIYLSSFILYGLPIISLLLAFFIAFSISKNELISLLFSFVGLALGFALVFVMDKVLRKYTYGKIVAKVEDSI